MNNMYLIRKNFIDRNLHNNPEYFKDYLDNFISKYAKVIYLNDTPVDGAIMHFKKILQEMSSNTLIFFASGDCLNEYSLIYMANDLKMMKPIKKIIFVDILYPEVDVHFKIYLSNRTFECTRMKYPPIIKAIVFSCNFQICGGYTENLYNFITMNPILNITSCNYVDKITIKKVSNSRKYEIIHSGKITY